MTPVNHIDVPEVLSVQVVPSEEVRMVPKKTYRHEESVSGGDSSEIL